MKSRSIKCKKEKERSEANTSPSLPHKPGLSRQDRHFQPVRIFNVVDGKKNCLHGNKESLYELANRICFILPDRGSGHITMFIIIMSFIAVVLIHRVSTLSFLKFYFRTSTH